MQSHSRKLAYKGKMSCLRSPSSSTSQTYKNRQTIFENGFTIVKDYRCRESPGFFWPLRVELMPTKDKLRNTIGYYVRYEFGRKEWYANFQEIQAKKISIQFLRWNNRYEFKRIIEGIPFETPI